MKKYLFVILFISVTPSFSQEPDNQTNSKITFYIGPTVGVAVNTNNGESVCNAGFSFEIQKNHHLFNAFFQSLFDFGPGSQPGNDKEYSITYTRIFGWKKFFIGIGSGVSVLHITKKNKWIQKMYKRRFKQ